MRRPPSGSSTRAALAQLRESFDTAQLLRWVDQWDASLSMLADPDAVRADILRLHAMTHALLNGGPLSVASTPAAVGEVATEVGMALDHWMALLTCMRRGLQPLEALVQDATD